MSNSNSEQMAKKTESQEKKATVEGLPMESSPYIKYNNLEDYKRNAYGTSGHLPVNPNQQGGGTDAPTPAGGPMSEAEAVSVIDAANRQARP